ncbi:hypothetical protein [Rhodopirellula sp. P2]|uniref:hypothetical protein n=1 Tax=Rhodopirellula sp. P2 TaxID=2127060 RepID=UPI002368C7B7|nr:hypothetical protein [Rhodopirellula sp. P2]WDQ16744.1 hypothetical protein PSR62_24470 [Rhodopirellula sp. P2]
MRVTVRASLDSATCFREKTACVANKICYGKRIFCMLFRFVVDALRGLFASTFPSTLLRCLQTSAVTLGFFNVFATARAQRVVIAMSWRCPHGLHALRWNRQRTSVSTSQKKFQKNTSLNTRNGLGTWCE